MSSAPPIPAGKPPSLPASDALPPFKHDPLAGFLSYLIPGLGQVYQGRIGKGLLFFFSLYLLFFYGQWMGQWKNVWLPDARVLPPTDIAIRGLSWNLEGVPKALAYRPQFLAQFWMGIAAWPACLQYRSFDKFNPAGIRVLGTYQRQPSDEEMNELIRATNNRIDLGWVFTVIAGVLNLLVIYDAFAGPMFRDLPEPKLSEPTPAGSSPPPPPLPGPTPESAAS